MEAARSFYENLPPPAECLAILVGCAQLTVFGLGGLANPISWARTYGLPIVPASRLQRQQSSTEQTKAAEEAEKTQIALISALTARNVRHGVVIVAAACYLRDRRAIAIALIANGISAISDALIVNWFGDAEQTAGHATGLVGTLALGSFLLRWRRDDPWW